MGTSSLSSSSAASESAEDQDVILVNGQASPTSAMSISPATSEVCSILSHHGSSRNVANAGHVSNNQLNSSKKKKNHSRASHQRQSNVDLVLDWRAPSSAKNAPTGTPPKSPKALSADDDTNWREHNHESSDKNSKPDAGDSNDWRTVTKNRKINDNNSSDQDKHKTKPGNNSNKPKMLDNSKTQKPTQDPPTSAKKKSQHKRSKDKKNLNSGKDTTSSTTEISDCPVPENRVSRLPGQIKPKRWQWTSGHSY